MTRLKQLALGGIAALAIGGMAGSASAEEFGTFQNRLNGATIGLPLGALPPPGLYTGLETAYINMAGGSGQGVGAQPNVKFAVPAQAVPLLYVPGWHFLGATYAMSVVGAFYEAQACAIGGRCNSGPFGGPSNATIGAGNMVTANPTFNPITLSWNLGGGWFVSGAFNFMAPIGTRAPGTSNPDYWTLEPAVAVSYLANNWVISGNFFYDINTQSPGTCCANPANGGLPITSGNTLIGDLTALYKIGKWEIGPVAYFEVQPTADTGPGCTPAICSSMSTFALGGLVGYDFGPVDLQVWATDTVASTNYGLGPGALIIWTRLGFRLWAPDAPKPLVAKN